MKTKLPNLTSAFLRFKLINALEEVTTDTIFGCQIHYAMKNLKYDEIIADIRMQIKDNAPLVEKIIGSKAFELINQYKHA